MGELACSALIGERRTDAAAGEKDVACIVEAPLLVHVVVRGKGERSRDVECIKMNGPLSLGISRGTLKGENAATQRGSLPRDQSRRRSRASLSMFVSPPNCRLDLERSHKVSL